MPLLFSIPHAPDICSVENPQIKDWILAMKFLSTTSFRSIRWETENYRLIEDSTPSPYGHSPYLICDEQRERVKASLWTAFLFCEDFSYISLRHIVGEGWYLDTFSLLRIFFNPSVTMCHLPLYFALQNAGEECRNLSITWFYCFYSPAVLPCSILCVATPVRLRDTAREECVNVLQCRGV